MQVVKPHIRRKGARNGVYARPRRAVGLAAELGCRLRPHAGSTACGECDLLPRGLPTGPTPGQSTLQRLFRQLDGEALAATLGTWVDPQATSTTTARAAA